MMAPSTDDHEADGGSDGDSHDIEAAAYERGYQRATKKCQAEINRLTRALEEITFAPDFGHAYDIACEALNRFQP